ncbi:MAG: Crp/Fnr family transcriptional regulator [Ekhidna sp.]
MDSQFDNLIHNAFGRYGELEEGAASFLSQNFKIQEFNSKDYLVEAGTVSKYFYLVISGVQVIYLIDKKGEKVVLGFSFDGSVSGVYDSFLSQTPSKYFIEALTTSKLIGLSHEKYCELFEKFPKLYQWRAYFMEEFSIGRSSRELEILTLSAKERFDTFMKRCPPQLLQIPQKYLASYLNMKPETFSRLRALRD